MSCLVVLGGLDNVLEFFGSLGPGERLAGVVVAVKKVREEIFEILLGVLHAVRKPLLAQDTEEALDQIDPGCVRGSVVKAHPGMAADPASQSFVFVDVQIIRHDVQFAIRIGPHDFIHEAEEIHRSAPIPNVSEHFSGGNFQGGNQRLRSVSHVLVGPATRLVGAKRQQWLRAIQSLNSRLVVHADDQRILGRIQIQADDVQQLGQEIGVRTEGERANPVRLQFRSL